jgi:hypothetical protein
MSAPASILGLITDSKNSRQEEIMENVDKGRVSQIFVLPPASHPDRFHNYYQFAHLFDAGNMDWNEVREAASELEKNWHETSRLPDDLQLLRSCLLIQVRYSRFVEGYPGESDMPYLDALVEKIKQLASVDSSVLQLKITDQPFVVTISSPETGELIQLAQSDFNKYMTMTNGEVIKWIVGNGGNE